METQVTNTIAPASGAEATDATKTVQQSATSQTPAQSDKAQRFKNRAENQASRALAEIEKMKKLSNVKYYSYTQDQITEMFGAIQTALDEAKDSFTTDNVEKKKLFTFSV